MRVFYSSFHCCIKINFIILVEIIALASVNFACTNHSEIVKMKSEERIVIVNTISVSYCNHDEG